MHCSFQCLYHVKPAKEIFTAVLFASGLWHFYFLICKLGEFFLLFCIYDSVYLRFSQSMTWSHTMTIQKLTT